MQRTKYAVEFKDEAVKQVVDKRHSVVDVAKRLGIGVSWRCQLIVGSIGNFSFELSSH